MTIQIVPTYDTPQYPMTSTLEGATFKLSFWYSQREQCWYLSVADATGLDIYNGMKLICGSLLMSQCADPRRPAGDFFVFDQTGANTPPALEDLVQGAGRCLLCYVTSDLIDAIAAADLATLTAFVASIASSSGPAGQSTYGQQ